MIEGTSLGEAPQPQDLAAEQATDTQFLDPKEVAKQFGERLADDQNTIWDVISWDDYPGGEGGLRQYPVYGAVNYTTETLSVESPRPYDCEDDEQHKAALREGEAAIAVMTQLDDEDFVAYIASPNNAQLGEAEDIVQAVLGIDEHDYNVAFRAAKERLGEDHDLTFDDICHSLGRIELVGQGDVQHILIPGNERRYEVVGRTPDDLETHTKLRRVVGGFVGALASQPAQS
ncbi:MAG TPA: hypothetical protein VIM53_00785 [Candidatus Saccharimonadales bacterium]